MEDKAHIAALEERLRQANETISALRCSLGQLKALADGDTDYAASWLQRKADAQRKALRRLNQRVINQRFVLSVINESGRGLTKEEWLAAKASKLSELGDLFKVSEDDSALVG